MKRTESNKISSKQPKRSSLLKIKLDSCKINYKNNEERALLIRTESDNMSKF